MPGKASDDDWQAGRPIWFSMFFTSMVPSRSLPGADLLLFIPAQIETALARRLSIGRET